MNTTTAGKQTLPSVGIDGANNFLVAWSGKGVGDSSGIFGQWYNASGSPVGGETIINTTTAKKQEDPSVGMANSGEVVVTWTSKDQDGSARGIIGREFDATGTPKGPEFIVNTTTFSNQQTPSVGMRGDHLFTIAWSGNGNQPSNVDNQGVFFQSYSRNAPPEITSDGGGPTASIEVPENTTDVTDVQSIDPEGETENGGGLTYSLTTTAGGGVDNSLFSINTLTGVLTFTDPPDFENPLDNDGNNDYEVQVTVTDSGGLTDVQSITLAVTDVIESTPEYTYSISARQSAPFLIPKSELGLSTGTGLTMSVESDTTGLLWTCSPDRCEAPATIFTTRTLHGQSTLITSHGYTTCGPGGCGPEGDTTFRISDGITEILLTIRWR